MNAMTALLTSTPMTTEGFGGFIRPTPMERAAGRLMRAPDHDAGTDSGNAGGGDGGAAGGDVSRIDAGGEATTDTLLGSADAGAGAGDGAGDGGEAGKDGEAAPAAADRPGGDSPGVPDSYDLKLVTQDAEGKEVETPLDPALLEVATPVFKDIGLTNEQAGKLLPLVGDVQQRLVEQQADQFAKLRADWAKQCQDDPDIGGAKLDETKRLAAKALDHYTGPAASKDKDGNDVPNAFRQLLNDSGLGNHPVMAKFLRQVGADLSEDGSFVRNTNEVQPKLSREQELYPNDVPKK